MIAVEGSIQTRTYEDKNGNKRKAVEVVVNNVHFCGSKSSNSSDYTAPAAPAPSYQSGNADDFAEVLPAEDDLPF